MAWNIDQVAGSFEVRNSRSLRSASLRRRLGDGGGISAFAVVAFAAGIAIAEEAFNADFSGRSAPRMDSSTRCVHLPANV